MTEVPAGLYRPNVGAILRREDGRILICERIDFPGSWQLPQGGVDPGETPESALWRELEEELGLEEPRTACRILDRAPAFRYDFPADVQFPLARRFRGQEQTLFLLEFTGTDGDFHLDADAKPEFRAFQWVFPHEAMERIWAPKRRGFEQSLRALSQHLT